MEVIKLNSAMTDDYFIIELKQSSEINFKRDAENHRELIDNLPVGTVQELMKLLKNYFKGTHA